MLALRTLILTLLLAAGPLAAQTPRMSLVVEPTDTPAKLAEVYAPLLAAIQKKTGYIFTLQTVPNHHFYWRDLRANPTASFAFEEAPFVDYRHLHAGYRVLVKTREPSGYSLLVADEGAAIRKQNLIGYRVATLPSPNLGSAALATMFPNPIIQPEWKASAISWRDAVELVFAGEAEAAIVPNHLATIYPNLRAVDSLGPLPGRALSASPDVSDEEAAKVAQAFLELSEDPDLYEVLVELNTEGFTKATQAEYRGQEALLRNFFGYKHPPGYQPPQAETSVAE